MSKFDWVDEALETIFDSMNHMDIDNQVELLNYIRRKLHINSPFKNEPIDLVVWEKSENFEANDYNPNRVAPSEMDLLTRSITTDGYTQPIVGYHTEKYMIVDGFHRYTVGSRNQLIAEKLHGYLPVTEINESQTNKSDRIASTIRHNRARGSHDIDLMVNIVGDLVESGMSDDWIKKNVGMDSDELLRFKQVSGLASLFRDSEFSQSWEVKENG